MSHVQGGTGGRPSRVLQRRVLHEGGALPARSRTHGRAPTPSPRALTAGRLRRHCMGQVDQNVMAVAGRRGSRSDARPARPTPVAVVIQSPPATPVVVAPPAAPRLRAGRDWIAPVAGLALGALVGHLVHAGIGVVHEAIVLGAAGAAAATLLFLRRRATYRTPMPAVKTPRVAAEPVPAIPTDLDRGVSDIRRTDPGFDAARFAGYAAMTFRDVHSAAAGDVAGLRHRVTPAMYVELEARGQRLRSSGRSVHVAAVEVGAEVTEAWQESGRDYVTAYVGGSMLRHTIDGTTGRIVEGSASNPVAVEAFLTFTRPAGLNFWMLSLIQGE